MTKLFYLSLMEPGFSYLLQTRSSSSRINIPLLFSANTSEKAASLYAQEPVSLMLDSLLLLTDSINRSKILESYFSRKTPAQITRSDCPSLLANISSFSDKPLAPALFLLNSRRDAWIKLYEPSPEKALCQAPALVLRSLTTPE